MIKYVEYNSWYLCCNFAVYPNPYPELLKKCCPCPSVDAANPSPDDNDNGKEKEKKNVPPDVRKEVK